MLWSASTVGLASGILKESKCRNSSKAVIATTFCQSASPGPARVKAAQRYCCVLWSGVNPKGCCVMFKLSVKKLSGPAKYCMNSLGNCVLISRAPASRLATKVSALFCFSGSGIPAGNPCLICSITAFLLTKSPSSPITTSSTIKSASPSSSPFCPTLRNEERAEGPPVCLYSLKMISASRWAFSILSEACNRFFSLSCPYFNLNAFWVSLNLVTASSVVHLTNNGMEEPDTM